MCRPPDALRYHLSERPYPEGHLIGHDAGVTSSELSPISTCSAGARFWSLRQWTSHSETRTVYSSCPLAITTSLVQTHVKFMSESVTPMRKRLSSSPECSMSESRETRLRRSLLHLPVVLHARSHIDLLYNLSLAIGPKTLTTNSQASPFVGLPNSSPCKSRTGTQSKSQSFNRDKITSSSSARSDIRDQGQRRRDREPKDSQPAHPFHRKGRGVRKWPGLK